MAAVPNLVAFMQSAGMPDKNYSLQDLLQFAQKYDPNASIVQNGNGDSILNYDQTKLPQSDLQDKGYAPVYNMDFAKGVEGVSGPGSSPLAPRKVDYSNAQWDPNYGWMIPNSQIGPIDEKMNNRQQASHGLLGIGEAMMPKSPLAVLLMAAGAGLGNAGLEPLQQMLGKLTLGALASGGKSLTNPMSYLGFVPGVGQFAPYIGAASSAYGLSRGQNPIGNAISLGRFAGGFGGGSNG